MGMANVLSEEKKQQVLALGRLGWSLRQIQQATRIRRETASQYLKAAGIAVRPPGGWGVLAQREMEKRRSPLVSIPPFGRGFSRHEGLSSDDFLTSASSAREEHPALLDIGSMSPPDYPSAWLRPRSARFRFVRQDHCSSATTFRFSTSLWPVIPPDPRPARPES